MINAGIGGYSTDQQLIFYKTRGQQYNPDLTVVLFYFNDILANSQPGFHRGYKPVFGIDKLGKLVLRNVPVPKPKNFQQDNLEKSESIWKLSKTRRLMSEIIRNLPALPWLNPEKQRDDMNISAQGGDYQKKGAVPAEYFVWQKKDVPMISKSWKMTEAILKQFKTETKKNGSELLIYYVPEKASIYPKIFNGLRLKYGLNDLAWDIQQDDRRLSEICLRTQVDCFNPIDHYISETRKLSVLGKSLFFDIDEHWNIRGQKFTGRLMTDIILEKYINQ